MIPRNRLERLPIPVPELAGYLVDSEGQVWRAGGAKGGKDRPLRPMHFTDAIRAWSQRPWFNDWKARARNPVLLLRPGVWRWHATGHPSGSSWNTHGHTDSNGFFMRYGPCGSGPRWNDSECDAARSCTRHAESPSWFVLRTAEMGRDSILVAGPIAFSSIRSREPLQQDGTDGKLPPR